MGSISIEKNSKSFLFFLISRRKERVGLIVIWLQQTYIVHCKAQVRLFLFPEEEDAEVLHQWNKEVRDILQRLGTPAEGIEELPVCVDNLGGDQGADHSAGGRRKLGFIVAAIVGGPEEEDGERGDVDGMYVLDRLASTVC